MKYVRNSGRKKDKKRKKEIILSKEQENAVVKQMLDDAKWVADLAKVPQFSNEWVHTVLMEILMQCMGKKDILTTNMFGQQIVARIFKEKGAFQIVQMIAKMNGHLFDTIKGQIKQTGAIEHKHKHEHKLIPDANRTIGVFEILEECGALKPPVKQLSSAEVELSAC